MKFSPVLPEWPTVALGDVLELKYGKSLAAASRSGDGFPVYGSNGVVGVHKESVTQGPTIIVGRKGSYGQINYSASNCWPIDTTYYVDESCTGADLRWLTHLLPTLGLDRMNKSAAVPGLSREDAYRVPLLLPPLDEQRRIATILDKADELRAKRREALAHLDKLDQSIFHSMFGPFLFGIQTTVGDTGLVQLGRQRAPKYQSGKHTRPYMRVANVKLNRLDLSDVLQMDFDQRDFKAYQLNHGDILLNEGQSTELVGRPAMWRNEIRDCCFQNTLVRYVADPRLIVPEFALATFLYYFHRGEFAKISSKTSSIAHLGAARFARMPMPTPPLELQQTFATRVDAVGRLKEIHRKHLAELDALFASLQHRAFKGEL